MTRTADGVALHVEVDGRVERFEATGSHLVAV